MKTQCDHYWEEDHRPGTNYGGYCCRKCGAAEWNPWAEPVKAQDLDLDDADIEALAEGEAPNSMGILDYEDLIQYLSRRLVEAQRQIFELEQGEEL